MSRRVLILLAVLIVAVVVVGLVLANLGNGGSSGRHDHPAANGTTAPVDRTSTPATPSACPLLSAATIATALHVAVQQGVVTGPTGSRECTWHSKTGGTVLTLSITNSGDELVLHVLGNNINGKVAGMGHFAVFAPSPPRLAYDPGPGVLVRLGPDGYRRFLPNGSTNPRAIPKTSVLPPLETLAKAAAAALK